MLVKKWTIDLQTKQSQITKRRKSRIHSGRTVRFRIPAALQGGFLSIPHRIPKAAAHKPRRLLFYSLYIW